MVFPVCVGELWLPWRRCTGWGAVAGPEGRSGPDAVTAVERVEPDYEIVASVLRTLALISAGIGA